MSLLNEKSVVEPIILASKRNKMDPYLLAATAFQEGYVNHALSAEAQSDDSIRRFDSYGSMGIDSFADYVGVMKQKGYLRRDYTALKVTGRKRPNEAGTKITITEFDDATSALEAVSGL